MDIEAKHIAADENGVLIAELDEMNYRHSLWDDYYNEDLLYKMVLMQSC
nr:hypothetical protein [Kineothrix alysoides]